MQTCETDQPWVVYSYGRTHDLWWPIWNSTRLLGRACIVARCAVCGDTESIWVRVPRFGLVPDQGHHPKRLAFLAAHAHPDRGAPMSWKLPLLNPGAHKGGIDLDALGMRLEADINEGAEPFDVGTPDRCWKCGTRFGVNWTGGDGGGVWCCLRCPHPAD